jgi:hypothetical protein
MSDLATTTAGTLRAAKAQIEMHGWSQGLNNAFGFAIPETWGGIDAHDAIVRCMGARRENAIRYLAMVIGCPGEGSIGIVGWNNSYGRTIEQVYDAFDRAISLAEGK